jgi:hypothetical protein
MTISSYSLDAGFQTLLVKPAKPDELVETIQSLTKGSKLAAD